jgi:DNA-binding transcriptional ArsR family regulator
MLHRLAQGECTVGQLAEPFDMSLAAASKHIKALEGAGLISRQVHGRTHVCQLNAGPLSQADEWLRHYERFWSQRLDRLEELLRLDLSDEGTEASAAAMPPSPAERRTPVKPAPQRQRRKR